MFDGLALDVFALQNHVNRADVVNTQNPLVLSSGEPEVKMVRKVEGPGVCVKEGVASLTAKIWPLDIVLSCNRFCPFAA